MTQIGLRSGTSFFIISASRCSMKKMRAGDKGIGLRAFAVSTTQTPKSHTPL